MWLYLKNETAFFETPARLLLPLGEFDAGDLAELAQELQL